MEDGEKKVRATVPAVWNGKSVRIMVPRYPVEELGEKIAHLKWLRREAPDQTATVITRNQPPVEVKLEDLELEDVG